MGIDKSTGTGVEQVEDKQPPDQHPPRPPDKPGQEPEGAQSRLEAHKAKAAAKEQAAEKPAQDTDEKPSPSAPSEQGSGYAEKKTESLTTQESTDPGEQDRSTSTPYEAAHDQPSTSVQELAGEQNESNEQPAAQRTDTGEQSTDLETQTAPPDSTNDRGAEQPSPEGTSPSEGVTVGNERAPADTTAAETNQPTPPDIEDAPTNGHPPPLDATETDDQPQPQDLGPPLDQPSAEPRDASSGTDSRAGAATANAEASDQSADITDSAPGQAEETAPAQEILGTSEIQDGTVDQQSEVGRHADDATPTSEIGKEDDQHADDTIVTTDRPTETAEAEDEGREQELEGTRTERKPQDLNLMVGDKTLREHIDPAGAGIGEQPAGYREPFERQIRDKDASWTDGVDQLDDLPTGEELVEPKPEDDDNSRGERLRKNFFRGAGDYQDAVKKNITITHDAFQRPPAGHPETKVCRDDPVAPVFASAPHYGVDIATAAANALIVAAAFGEGVRRIRERHAKGGER